MTDSTHDLYLEQIAETLLVDTCGLSTDEHGKDTPKRFVKMLRELTTWEPFEFKTFPNDGMDEMIIVRDIPFVSVCNHHIIPFIGKAHIGYVPRDEIVGLSKFARVVNKYSRALQVQERVQRNIWQRVSHGEGIRHFGSMRQSAGLIPSRSSSMLEQQILLPTPIATLDSEHHEKNSLPDLHYTDAACQSEPCQRQPPGPQTGCHLASARCRRNHTAK